MSRWPAFVLLALLLALARPGHGVDAAAPAPTTIAGGDLAHPLRLTAIDADAFARRINLPPILDNAPDLEGLAYTVTSPYWDAAVRDNHDDKAPVAADALYYPQGGFVLTTEADDDVWLVLDLRQRAILDRYIRLGQKGMLSAAPSELELLAAAAPTEAIAVAAGERPLSASESSVFWSAVGTLKAQPGPGQVPVAPDDAGWFVISLPEGRSVQLLADPRAGSLTDALGAETYALPAALVPLLGTEPVRLATTPSSPGSPLWWVVMVGAGLASLGAAIWLSKRGARA